MKLICSLIAAGLQLFFPKEDIMLAASKKISKGLLFLFFFRPAMPVIFGFVYMVSMGVSSLQSWKKVVQATQSFFSVFLY